MAASFLLHLVQVPTNFRCCLSVSASSSNGGVPFPFPPSKININKSSPPSPVNKSRGGGPVIVEIPLDKIRRPLMRTRSNDPDKVQDLMISISEIGLQVPIDVLEVDGVIYGFSGCHRYEAHQRLGLPTIRCKVRRGTKETLRHHLR